MIINPFKIQTLIFNVSNLIFVILKFIIILQMMQIHHLQYLYQISNYFKLMGYMDAFLYSTIMLMGAVYQDEHRIKSILDSISFKLLIEFI